MTFFEELKWRGLIKDVSSEEIINKINNDKITFYWGTDPTADSLHLGHYSSLVTAKRLAKYGHHPIILVGGATGLIGDPRPTAEREIISIDAVNKNLEGLKKQVLKFFGNNVEIVNNYDWFKDYSFLNFLRDIGKYINVNYLLDKDIIKRRLSTGITYAEFSYTLIQGYDFYNLLKEKKCTFQVAGSDQWGNITTGIEIVRKLSNEEVYGFTMPLVLDKNNKKFGKSEGNALWIDKSKTSSYEIYQYLINVDDSLVIDYLKIFTFLSKEEIEQIEVEHFKNPELREAQKILAREIITDLHGMEEYEKAVKLSQVLFTGKVNTLNKREIELIFKDIDETVIEEDTNIIDLLVLAKAATSKREAREFVSNNSIIINESKIDNLDYVIKKSDAIDDTYIVIKRGKKKYFLVKYI